MDTYIRPRLGSRERLASGLAPRLNGKIKENEKFCSSLALYWTIDFLYLERLRRAQQQQKKIKVSSRIVSCKRHHLVAKGAACGSGAGGWSTAHHPLSLSGLSPPPSSVRPPPRGSISVLYYGVLFFFLFLSLGMKNGKLAHTN